MARVEIEAEKSSNTDGIRDGPLDPMIRGLLDFVEHGDLSARIQKIFQRMDLDENSGISLPELNAGLKKLLRHSEEICQLSPEDFEQITAFGDLTDEHGELDLQSFETMIMMQLRHYANKKICAAIVRTEDDVTAEQIFGIKMIMMHLYMLQHRFDQAFPDSYEYRRKLNLKQTLSRWVERGTLKAFNAWKALTFDPELLSLEQLFDDYQDVSSRSLRNLLRPRPSLKDAQSGGRDAQPENILSQSQNTLPPAESSVCDTMLQSVESTHGPDGLPSISSVSIDAIDFSVPSHTITTNLAYKAASLDSMMQQVPCLFCSIITLSLVHHCLPYVSLTTACVRAQMQLSGGIALLCTFGSPSLHHTSHSIALFAPLTLFVHAHAGRQMSAMHKDMRKDILSLSLRDVDRTTSTTTSNAVRANVGQPQHSVSQASAGAAEVVWVHGKSGNFGAVNPPLLKQAREFLFSTGELRPETRTRSKFTSSA